MLTQQVDSQSVEFRQTTCIECGRLVFAFCARELLKSRAGQGFECRLVCVQYAFLPERAFVSARSKDGKFELAVADIVSFALPSPPVPVDMWSESSSRSSGKTCDRTLPCNSLRCALRCAFSLTCILSAWFSREAVTFYLARHEQETCLLHSRPSLWSSFWYIHTNTSKLSCIDAACRSSI